MQTKLSAEIEIEISFSTPSKERLQKSSHAIPKYIGTVTLLKRSVTISL